jgi:AbrB family looped-hinge helix DNA binding protein
MRVFIDEVGRIVIPKPIRSRMGLVPDTELTLSIDGSGLRLDPVRNSARGFSMVQGFPVLDAHANQALSDDDVRRLRDEEQR